MDMTKYRNYLGNAIACSNRGDYLGAIRCYKKMDAEGYATEDSITNMASCWFELEEYEEAYECYRRLEIEGIDTPGIYYSSAQAFRFRGEYRIAIMYYNKAIKKLNCEPNFFLNKGVCYLKLGKYEAALYSFEGAEKLGSKNPKVYAFKGDCLKELKAGKTALEYYNKAIQLGYSRDELKESIKFCSLPINQKDDLWEQMKLQRREMINYAIQAEEYFEQRYYEKALEYYLKADKAKKGEGDIYWFIGECLLRMHRYDEALNYFYKADEYGDLNGAVFSGIGLCFMHLERLEEAVRILEKAATIDVIQSENYYLMVVCLLILERWDKALENILLAEKYGREEKSLRKFKAEAYFGLRDFDKALFYFEKIYLDGDIDAISLNNMGFCLIHMSRYEEALKILKEAEALDSKRGKVCIAIIDCLINLERYDEALLYINKMEALPSINENLKREYIAAIRQKCEENIKIKASKNDEGSSIAWGVILGIIVISLISFVLFLNS